ncbi:TPA: hypothetical protein ACXP8P_000128 [Klebsiella variicola subsp. variicola]
MMKRLLLAVALLGASGVALAGNCDSYYGTAADGSQCGLRSADSRVRPMYAQPVYVQPQQKYVTEEQAEARTDDMRTQALNDMDTLTVNTGKQRWLCPVTESEGTYHYRTVEIDPKNPGDVIIVDGHKWHKNGDGNYSNNLYSEYAFMIGDDNGEFELWDEGNTGNTEISRPCVPVAEGLPAKYTAENPIDEVVLNIWRGN